MTTGWPPPEPRPCPLDPFCLPASHTQSFLVSKARRVAELTQCLAKELHPGHRPLSGLSASRRCRLVNPLLLVQAVGRHPGQQPLDVGVAESCRLRGLVIHPCNLTLLPGAGDICHQLLHFRSSSGDPGKLETEEL